MADPKIERKVSILSHESMKVIGESVGLASLPDEASYVLAEDATFRLKLLVQEAVKFMQKAKRRKLSSSDFDFALQDQNVEPLYGLSVPDSIPFRFTSGGGRELHFIEEKDFDLTEMISSPLPKVPLDVALKAHWLCVEGVQPAIPENPPPVDQEEQKVESTRATTHQKPIINPKQDKESEKDRVVTLLNKAKEVAKEVKRTKDILSHELSVEQQLYYKEITEACVGSSEPKRAQALQSLASDSGLYQMLPRFSSFISEGVRVNVVQSNLALLIYLMRMVKALMDNPTLYLEKYLHEIIPAVMTCIVSKQLCLRPDIDNHWALRDFAARLMASICKKFSTSTNNIQARVSKTFDKSLSVEYAPLPTIYGAFAGLSELGPEVIKAIVLPKLKPLSERIKNVRESSLSSNFDKIAAEHLKSLVLKQCSPYLKQARTGPDTPDAYIEDFGSIGSALCNQVQKLRSQPGLTANKPTIQIPPPRQSPLSSGPRTPNSASPVSRTQSGGSRGSMPRSVSVPGGPTTPTGKQTKFIVMSSIPQNSKSSTASGGNLSPVGSKFSSSKGGSSHSPTGLSKSASFSYPVSIKEEPGLSQSMSAVEGRRRSGEEGSNTGTSMLMSLAHAATLQAPYKTKE